MKKMSKNVKTVFKTLCAEVEGDVDSTLKLLDTDYTMTWVYIDQKGKLFPRTKKNVKQKLEDVYHIKDRRYNIKHIAEGDKVVMIEMIESYQDPKTKKVYRTPLVIVLEMKDGKIKRGRHYCDPRLSRRFLTNRQIQKAFL